MKSLAFLVLLPLAAQAEDVLMPPPPTAEMIAAFPNAPAVQPCAAAPAGMACVEGGPFIRGSDDGPEMARPQAFVWQQTFFMDINEVTYADYKACERKGKCNKAGPKYRDFDRPQQPINGVSWYDAVKYCRGARQAPPHRDRVGEGGPRRPTGAPTLGQRAVHLRARRDHGRDGPKLRHQEEGQRAEKGRVWEVGQKPAYLYGLKDMIGNSYEWVADWYSHSWADCGEKCLGINPKGPCDGKEPCKKHHRKVVRGGSWYWGPDHGNALYRREHIPANHPAYHHFGFRCAATVEEAAKIATP
ncbi:MAG: formylglycine-generating enzyme family protein [bacterium]